MSFYNFLVYVYLHSPDFIRYSYYRYKYNIHKSVIMQKDVLIDGKGKITIKKGVIIGSRCQLTAFKGTELFIDEKTHISNDVRLTTAKLKEKEYSKGIDTYTTGNIRIGKQCFLHPYNFLYGKTKVSDHTIIKPRG